MARVGEMGAVGVRRGKTEGAYTLVGERESQRVFGEEGKREKIGERKR
jgi:hypothetical protein